MLRRLTYSLLVLILPAPLCAAEPTAPKEPTFVVYSPKTWDGPDATNEHFLVVPARSGAFLAFWTQASEENARDQHIVMMRSKDRGRTWSAPVTVAGDPSGATGRLASWAYPFVVPATGRVYLFWNQNIGIVDAREDTTGALMYCWSDDEGEHWSERHTLRIRHSAISHPDPEAPENFVTYQAPVITRKNEVLVGFTRWASMRIQPKVGLFERDSEVWFLRFDRVPLRKFLRSATQTSSSLRNDAHAEFVDSGKHRSRRVVRPPLGIPAGSAASSRSSNVTRKDSASGRSPDGARESRKRRYSPTSGVIDNEATTHLFDWRTSPRR